MQLAANTRVSQIGKFRPSRRRKYEVYSGRFSDPNLVLFFKPRLTYTTTFPLIKIWARIHLYDFRRQLAIRVVGDAREPHTTRKWLLFVQPGH